MILLLLAIAILVLSGLLALFSSRWLRCCTVLGAGGAVAGCVVGLVPAVRALAGEAAESLRWPWHVPLGSFSVELDALSAFFVIPILGLSALAAIFGSEYLLAHRARQALGRAWFFYNVLVASMVLVVVARNAILFLVAWEIMALSSYFLVTFEDEKASVRRAGWIYLVTTHLSTASLLILFVLVGQGADPLDFDAFTARGSLSPASANLLFLLAVMGFGTKAGFIPFHVWLPEAHPAAPSHVSAVMSGVMIKTGIYGLVRVLTFLGHPPEWWGWLLIGIGLLSGVWGVLLALAQHDLKRLLAYHSVENIGIIALGLGVGLLGLSCELPALAVLGFAGGLLHVVNHALFKGLLFLGAGTVLHGTGTGQIDELGGLAKRMPWTAVAFLTGAIAISGLPPFNGFVSEFLIYLAAFDGEMALNTLAAIPPLAIIAGLALIGGLAAACFAKAFGVVFLGEPRSEHAAMAHPPGRLMRWPMVILAVACLLGGVLGPLVVPAMAPVVEIASGLQPETVLPSLAEAARPLTLIVVSASILILMVLGLAFLRYWLLMHRPVGESATWGCGYAQPTPRMQYTGSSFAQPLTDLFHALLRTKTARAPLTEYFPQDGSLATHTPDLCQDSLFKPLLLSISWGLSKLRWLQQGYLQIYLLYIFGTLVLLLLWQLVIP
jgi:formate hydrogenlyase subunit 3/multisubunit Na+/H+ antiporter MnhD subunit